MKLLNRLFILIYFFIFSISFANEKEEVLFSIEGIPTTTIDLNQRIDYLKLFNPIFDTDLNNKVYFNDLISVMIFNQFAVNKRIKTDTKIIEDYYNSIIKNYEKNNASKFEESQYSIKLSKEIITKNIVYDIQRKQILDDAIAISNSGVFAIVLECVVEDLAKIITKSVSVPTIGIGASKYCDGQILVTDDMLGLSDFFPKFVKQYSNLKKVIEKSVKNYVRDVKLRKFPSDKNVYK